MSRRWAWCLGAMGLTAGCASPSGPEHALQAYRQALLRGDSQTLWTLTSSSARAGATPQSFERFMSKHPATVDRAARALQPASNRVEWFFPSNEQVHLVREEDVWRVAHGPLLVPGQATPMQAIRTFLFASRGNLSMLRRLLPEEVLDRYRSDAALAKRLGQIQHQVDGLRAGFHPQLPVTVEGDRAWVAYGPELKVRLIRQDGRWRILDLR